MRWRKPQDFNDMEIYAGDSFLVRVDVLCDGKTKKRRDFAFKPTYDVITATERGFECNGESWGWSWDDVECFIPCKEFDDFPFGDEDSSLPPCAKNAPEIGS